MFYLIILARKVCVCVLHPVINQPLEVRGESEKACYLFIVKTLHIKAHSTLKPLVGFSRLKRTYTYDGRNYL